MYPRKKKRKKENKPQQKYLNNLKPQISYHLTTRQLNLVLHSLLYSHILLLKKSLNWLFQDKIKISHLFETLSSTFGKLSLIFEHGVIAFYTIPVLLSLRSCCCSCVTCFSMLIDFVLSTLSILGRWKPSPDNCVICSMTKIETIAWDKSSESRMFSKAIY